MDVMHPMRTYFDQAVYYGPLSDLEKGGKAEVLNQVAIKDRFTVQESQISFLAVDDTECMEETQHPDTAFEDGERYFAFYNGDAIESRIVKLGSEEATAEELIKASTF